MKLMKKIVVLTALCATIFTSTLNVSAAGEAMKCPRCPSTGEWVGSDYTVTCNKCGGTMYHYTCRTAGHAWIQGHTH